MSDPGLIAATGATSARPLPGGVFAAEMALGRVGTVPVVVRISRVPVDADELTLALGLAAAVPCAALVIIAAAGRTEGLDRALSRHGQSVGAPQILVVDPG